VPRHALIDFIKPHYPKTSKKGGRTPVSTGDDAADPLVAAMVFAQRPCDGGGPNLGSHLGRFAGIELISNRIPDETTILIFRPLLEKHGLGEQIFKPSKPTSAQRA